MATKFRFNLNNQLVDFDDFYVRQDAFKQANLWTWGSNSQGQLGDNTTTNKSSPIQTVAYGNNWKSIACGGYFVLSTNKDGTLWAWGQNNFGQLGDNTTINKSSPIQTVVYGNNWSLVAGGSAHTAAIKTDGTLWTWGRNDFFQLGDGGVYYYNSPVQTVASTYNWDKFSIGIYYAAAIKTDGTLWTWGNNRFGQLGDNTITHRSSPIQTITLGTDWSFVSCGNYHTAAIKKDGTLWTWGWNNAGQLGDNTVIHRSSPIQTIAGGTNWSSVASGYSYTAAIKTDGTLWTWGRNLYGNLGDYTRLHRSSPVQTTALGTNWSKIACGLTHVAAIKTDGTLWNWGNNGLGQLGENVVLHRSSPVQNTIYGTLWNKLSSGTYHNAAIKNDGSLWLWGSNNYGQLGNNLDGSTNSPTQTITYGTNWSQVSCGSDFTAAIKNDGTLWLWGKNTSAQLGDNTAIHRSSPVQTISAGTNWSQVSCGGSHVAAVKTDGTLWIWGYSWPGALGDNTGFNLRSSPVQVVGDIQNWSQVSCGSGFTTAIKKDGTLWSWGANWFGTLGDNTTIHRSSPVQTVTYGTNWKAVAGGSSSSLGVDFIVATKTDGTLWRWGNYLGPTTSSPVQTVAFGTGWSEVSVSAPGGNGHASVKKTDGTLWFFGSNAYGQLGINSIVSTNSPVQTVALGSDWSSFSCGGFHTIATKTDGSLWVWGRNSNGTLALNEFSDRSSPIQTIAYGTNWSTVSCGGNATAATKTDGTLWIWGSNGNGQLGDNTTTNRSSPVQTVALGTNWSSVSFQSSSISATKTDGTLWVWGSNNNGFLGDGTLIDKSSPIQTVSYGTDWSKPPISSSNARNSGAIKKDGSLWVWGSNIAGSLAINSSILHRSSPVQTVGAGSNWISVSCGQYFTAGIKTDGTLWTWGNGQNGQLGNNSTSNISAASPIQTISGGNNWKSLSCGLNHMAAIKTDGTLWTWGVNNFGQLGDNTTIFKSSPVQTVVSESNWSYVACGSANTAAIKTDGTLWTWGYNIYGQLGENTTINKSSPVQTITGGSNWSKVACGLYYTAAIKTDGTLWTWGYNSYGQLGDNTRTNRSSPVQVTATVKSWKSVSCGYFQTVAMTYYDAVAISTPTSTPTPSLPVPYTIPGLVLYLDASVASSYPGTGTSWYNLAYIGNTATLTNGPTFSSANGGSIVFDGTNDYAIINRPVQDDFSLCCWFKTTQNAGTAVQWYNGMGIMDCEVGGVVNDYGLSMGAGQLMFGTGNSDVTIISSNTFNDGKWHFVVGTRAKSAGALALYVDGAYLGTSTGGTNSLTSPTYMTIGCRQTIDNYFAGNIAVAMAYNTTLSATDVTNLWTYFRSRFGV